MSCWRNHDHRQGSRSTTCMKVWQKTLPRPIWSAPKNSQVSLVANQFIKVIHKNCSSRWIPGEILAPPSISIFWPLLIYILISKQKNTPQKKTKKTHHLHHTILDKKNRKNHLPTFHMPFSPHPQTKKQVTQTNPSQLLQCGDGSGLQNELIHTHQGHGVTTRHILGRVDSTKNSRCWSETKKKTKFPMAYREKKGFLKSEDIQLGK